MPTEISWTDETWNPLRGCTRVSPGCQHCYAERMAARSLPGHKSPTTGEPFAIMTPSGPRWTGKVELIESRLMEPFKWRKPRKIFVNSMSDLFHESVSDEWIDRIFAVMALARRHTFQVLTKRADRMHRYLSFVPSKPFPNTSTMYQRVLTAAHHFRSERPGLCGIPISDPIRWPLPNVWLGVSVEDRARKDRIDWLRKTPAAVRFLSCEPLLEDLGTLDLTGIHQVIVGGESGPGAKPMHPDWVRGLRDQCKEADVPFHFKQWGEHCDWDNLPDETYRRLDANGVQPCEGMIRVGKKWTGALLDGREWREFPKAAGAEVEE